MSADEKPKIAGPWTETGAHTDVDYHVRRYQEGSAVAGSIIRCGPRCIWSAWRSDDTIIAEGDEHIDLATAKTRTDDALLSEGVAPQ